MQVWFPKRTEFPIPLWMRIFAGSLAVLAGILLLKHPLDFMWVQQLCLGTWCFAMPPLREPGESKREYWKKPRMILSLLLLIGSMGGALHSLYILYGR